MNDRQPSLVEAFREPASDNQALPVLPPRVALIEMLVLLVLPAALDHFWPVFPSLSEMHPHFFWLPVLLLSLQYGTVSGLLAAGLAIALSASLGWPDQEVGENHFSYLLRVWSQPVLWLTAALVLGQFRMRQIERKQGLARQVAELSSQRKALADYSGNLRTRCETLEREIARRRDPSARAVLNALGHLDAADGDELRARFSECLRLAFGPSQIAVFAREGNDLKLVVRHSGGETIKPARDLLSRGEALADVLLSEGRALSVMVPGEETLLGNDGLVAVPVISPRVGEIIGMLKLEVADASELDADTARRLAVIAIQIAPLLERNGAGALVQSAANQTGLPPLRPSARQRLWRQMKWQPRAGRAAASASKSSYHG